MHRELIVLIFSSLSLSFDDSIREKISRDVDAVGDEAHREESEKEGEKEVKNFLVS